MKHVLEHFWELSLQGELVLVEFKRRTAARAFDSDVVELSVQRHVLRECGLQVSSHAFVVVFPGDGSRATAIGVELEHASAVELRIDQLLDAHARRVPPRLAESARVCRGCGHRDVCSSRLGGA